MFEFYRLKNNVRVVLVPMQGVESVAVGVYVGTGSRYETPGINGISHFTEHMAFKGTKKFPTHKETSYLEGLGAMQNAWTDVDTTAYYCKIQADKWKQGLEMAKELALNPLFPKADLEIERGVIIEEINRGIDMPDQLVGEQLMKLMFGSNPLGMTILGNPEVIKSLQRDDFINYHKKRYVPDQIVVVMAGALKQINDIKICIKDWFELLEGKSEGSFEPVLGVWDKPGIKVMKKQLAAQAHIELAVPGLTVDDPRRFAMSILTSYLGQGLSSRLFIELREKRGLCYSVRADEDRLIDTGLWSVYAGVSIDKLVEAVGAIKDEMERMKAVRLTDEEMMAAFEKMRGPVLFSMESPISQMNWYAKQALDKPDKMMTHSEVILALEKVKSDDVLKVAGEIFINSKLNLAVVGPLDRHLEESLAKVLGI